MIRKIEEKDYDKIVLILKTIQDSGDSYFFLDMSDDELRNFWKKPKFSGFVYVDNNDQVLGSCIIGPIADGRFSHIANSSYIVSSDSRGLGIGRKLAEYSIEYAKSQGYKAIQFLRVVSTNKSAVELWQKVGFKIIATVPKGFCHKKLGYVDSYIFYKDLEN